MYVYDNVGGAGHKIIMSWKIPFKKRNLIKVTGSEAAVLF